MSKAHCRIETFPTDHSTFGGIILFSDFNTNEQGRRYAQSSRIAQRIIKDWNFDRECRRNIENRKQFM